MLGRGYNLVLMAFWLLIFLFVVARELVLPPQAAAQLAGPRGWMAAIVAFAFATYNFARWWYLRQMAYPHGIHTSPLAQRLPDPDKPPPKWEPNPELDFTKTDENKPEEGTTGEGK